MSTAATFFQLTIYFVCIVFILMVGFALTITLLGEIRDELKKSDGGKERID
jgi:hypothetical protein